MEFKFCYGDSYAGQLSPELVHLFYYDICFDHEEVYSKLYEWSEEVETYLKDNKVEIETKESDEMPQTVECNQIFYVGKASNKGNKAADLFFRLRNSFVHYNIGINGRHLCLKDKDSKGITMIGKIDIDLLKGLIAIFLKQKNEIEEKFNSKQNDYEEKD